jgi:hypothetical protein
VQIFGDELRGFGVSGVQAWGSQLERCLLIVASEIVGQKKKQNDTKEQILLQVTTLQASCNSPKYAMRDCAAKLL